MSKLTVKKSQNVHLSNDITFSYRNVLNVDEPSQLITVETSLRMTWRDPRLTVRIPAYSPTNYVFFRSDVTRHIWFPDVYIDGVQDLRSPAYKVDLIKKTFF